MKFHVKEHFDDLSELPEILKGYDAFFCTLGTVQSKGQAEFTKVDYQYPLDFAKVAE